MSFRDNLATAKLLLDIRKVWRNWRNKITPDMVTRTVELLRDFIKGKDRK